MRTIEEIDIFCKQISKKEVDRMENRAGRAHIGGLRVDEMDFG